MAARPKEHPSQELYGVFDTPKSWYFEHVLSNESDCFCRMDKPSKTCDLGESLFRLKKREEKVELIFSEDLS